jgi:hypothetical protein
MYQIKQMHSSTAKMVPIYQLLQYSWLTHSFGLTRLKPQSQKMFSQFSSSSRLLHKKCYGLAFSVTTILLAAIGILLCILCAAALCLSGVQQGT